MLEQRISLCRSISRDILALSKLETLRPNHNSSFVLAGRARALFWTSLQTTLDIQTLVKPYIAGFPNPSQPVDPETLSPCRQSDDRYVHCVQSLDNALPPPGGKSMAGVRPRNTEAHQQMGYNILRAKEAQAEQAGEITAAQAFDLM